VGGLVYNNEGGRQICFQITEQKKRESLKKITYSHREGKNIYLFKKKENRCGWSVSPNGLLRGWKKRRRAHLGSLKEGTKGFRKGGS